LGIKILKSSFSGLSVSQSTLAVGLVSAGEEFGVAAGARFGEDVRDVDDVCAAADNETAVRKRIGSNQRERRRCMSFTSPIFLLRLTSCRAALFGL